MIDFQIPDEALDQLSRLLEVEGGYQWDVGDFLLDFWVEILKYIKPDEVREAHAEMIHQFAKGTKADETTLRDRKKMSETFSPDIRAEYPMFSYHQWRALRSADDWGLYIEQAADEGWTVRQIRRAIKKDKDPKEVLIADLDKIDKKARKIMDDEEVSKAVRESLFLIPTIIQDTKELV